MRRCCAEFCDGWSGGIKLLCIDHDHGTGEARGLLCQRCNVALGNMGDDPERVRNLARYLVERKWGQRG
ncbi:endonuclease domain-containing protein [Arthrobacter humicola]|uniref:endonuclease domain-containing protein n=1 Tax=Arthrobacter humicola TaxID=409291 RepID=UPI0034D487FC